MKKTRPLPRRAVALAAAASTLWVVWRTADLDAAKTTLFSSRAIVTGLLEYQLGQTGDEDALLDGWAALVVDQSPVLTQGKEAVSASLTQQEETADERSESDPVPETDPADQAGDTSAPETETASASAEAEEAEEPESEIGAESEAEVETETEDITLDLSQVKTSQIKVDNHTDGLNPSVADYWEKEPSLTLQPASAGPQILIMHTHATEAYTMDGDDVYTESDESRTTDENYNMIRVGEEMKAVFEELGFSVVHDTTTYDYPGYNGSYGRSLEGVQSYLEQYPTIQVVLDVHRDALIGSDGTVYAKTTAIDGEQVAQVMLVVGTDDGGLTHPNWEDNFTLALKLQGAMLALDDTLPRDIDLRSQRFNQHLTAGSLLVEVGTSGNTLQEALAGARLFAQAAGTVYSQYVVSS
ncbi:MAG: stage II sporulation protein P [Clostridiales bacterium]|nr:stage II sporulation protein P [Clostridiales bacterium]